jgi:hypothetical protein
MNDRFRTASQNVSISSQGFLALIRGLMAGESATIERLRSELAVKQATVDMLLKGFVATDFPVVAGLTFDVLYQPAAAIEQLGGNWYDIFTLPDGRVAFSLGDVCGRGLGAAVKMGKRNRQSNSQPRCKLATRGRSPCWIKQIRSSFSTTIMSNSRRPSTE